MNYNKLFEGNNIKDSRNIFLNFWILNITGWIIYLIIFLPFAYKFYGHEFYKIILAVVHVIFGFLLSLGLRWIYKKFELNRNSIIKIGIWVILISFLTTFIWERLDDVVRIMFVGWEKGIKHDNFISMIYEVIWSTPTILAWGLFYFSINIYRNLEKEKENSLKTQALFVESQLEMLRYQLNPHFIFNAMSSLRALVQKDQLKAKEMITKLAEFLRYALVGDNQTEVPLQKELEITESYLDIEKVRFGNKLNVKFEIEDHALEYPVPSFILQPLIDNAIKHGITNDDDNLNIEVEAGIIQKDTLQICVKNNGSIRSNDNNLITGTRTGISNIKKRLQLLYPNESLFDLSENMGIVCAKILIKKSL